MFSMFSIFSMFFQILYIGNQYENLEQNIHNSIINTQTQQFDDICQEFTLNSKQSEVAKIFTEPLLNHELNPRLVYLTGEGGTGKSQAIIAITEYFRRMGKSDQLLIAALTGSAASLIGGETIHKLIGLNSFGKGRLKSKKVMNIRKYQKIWENVNYLIIDEISMAGLKLLNEINLNLQLAKNNTDRNFGGINILFVGDFAQLPPVCQKPLYTQIDKNVIKELKSNNSNSILNAGRLLWLNLTHCIILTEQIRQNEDLHYAQIVRRLRTRNHTEQTIRADYNILKSRIISTLDPIITAEWDDAPIIVSRNELRENLNKLKIERYATNNNLSIYYHTAIDHYASNGKSINENEKKKI